MAHSSRLSSTRLSSLVPLLLFSAHGVGGWSFLMLEVPSLTTRKTRGGAGGVSFLLFYSNRFRSGQGK